MARRRSQRGGELRGEHADGAAGLEGVAVTRARQGGERGGVFGGLVGAGGEIPRVGVGAVNVVEITRASGCGGGVVGHGRNAGGIAQVGRNGTTDIRLLARLIRLQCCGHMAYAGRVLIQDVPPDAVHDDVRRRLPDVHRKVADQPGERHGPHQAPRADARVRRRGSCPCRSPRWPCGSWRRRRRFPARRRAGARPTRRLRAARGRRFRCASPVPRSGCAGRVGRPCRLSQVVARGVVEGLRAAEMHGGEPDRAAVEAGFAVIVVRPAEQGVRAEFDAGEIDGRAGGRLPCPWAATRRRRCARRPVPSARGTTASRRFPPASARRRWAASRARARAKNFPALHPVAAAAQIDQPQARARPFFVRVPDAENPAVRRGRPRRRGPVARACRAVR